MPDDVKPPMPPSMLAEGEAAIARHHRRKWAPDITETENGWDCPFADEHRDAWWALLYDVFGTRQASVVKTFLNQLRELAPSFWKAGVGFWQAEEDSFRTMLALIQSVAPRNAAQAAHAAQLVALHLSAMKLGDRAINGDPHAVALLNKTVRAYGEGLERFERFNGRGGRSRQTIVVRKQTNVQVNHHRGRSENDGQSQATQPAAITGECYEVPGQSPDRSVVPFPGRTGQARLPDARGTGGRTKR